MPTATIDDFEAALKTLYQNKVAEVGHQPPKLWAMLRKDTNFRGEDNKIPLQFGRTQGSHTFATAQSRSRASAYEKFLVKRGKHYHIIRITEEGVLAGQGDGAVVPYLQRETRSGQARSRHYLNRNIFRNNGGQEFQIESGAGTPTMTVTDRTQLIGLDINDFITSSTDDGSPVPGAGVIGTATQISAIDRTLGTVTRAGGNWSANGFADNHFTFLDGNYGLGYFGLKSWFPRTAPAAGDPLFFGMDRSKDPLRLAGQRFVAEAADGTIEKFLKRACSDYGVQGGTGKLCVMSPRLRNQLEVQLGARVRYGRLAAYTSKGPHATMGFESIMLTGDYFDMNVIGDRDCPYNDAYFLDLDTFWWKGLGEAPRYLTYEGMGGNGGWLRIGDEDGLEGRLGSKGQFVCDAPACNANLFIPFGTVGE